jgi:putative ABC transport system permease protein
MTLLALVRRNLRQHAAANAVTAGAVALSAGLLMAVWGLQSQSRKAFSVGSPGFDAVLGARGSRLQLVLNAVYHLDTSPGNIPWLLFKTVAADPRVATAIPFAVGDNFRGHRLVGTTMDIFSHLKGVGNRPLSFSQGGPFRPDQKEAVVGSRVAEQTGLRIGATFNPYHGVVFDESMRHADVFHVKGILNPTNTPADRVIYIPIEGLFRLGGHVLRGSGSEFTPLEGKEIPDEHKELSAVLLKFRSPQTGFAFDQTINKQGRVATLAWPVGAIMMEFLDRFSWVTTVLTLSAVLTALVAGGGFDGRPVQRVGRAAEGVCHLAGVGGSTSTVVRHDSFGIVGGFRHRGGGGVWDLFRFVLARGGGGTCPNGCGHGRSGFSSGPGNCASVRGVAGRCGGTGSRHRRLSHPGGGKYCAVGVK